MTKRSRFLSILTLVLMVGVVYFVYTSNQAEEKRVKVGILHSLEGTMALSEKGVVEATLAAIEEINAKGGILGYTIVPVIADGKSDPKVFGEEASRLIEGDGVKAIFGCWTSASRKEVKPVVELHDHLLFYPVQYEGAEVSNSIVYLGQLPNQQLKPALFFALENLGDSFYLVGSDYIFPRVANLYLKDTLSLLGGKVLGDRYVRLAHQDFKAIVADIKAKRPKVILNTLNGDSNLYFFRELLAQGVKPEQSAVISFSIAEEEVAQIAQFATPASIVGHYASWSYFDTIDSPENHHFVELMKNHGYQHQTDPMESAYVAVWLYKQAVEEAQSFDPYLVKQALPYQSFKGPGGITTLTSGNLNSWKNSRVAKVTPQLDFEIVEQSSQPIKPQNFSKIRSQEEYKRFIYGLYNQWNNQWVAP